MITAIILLQAVYKAIIVRATDKISRIEFEVL